MFARAGKVLAGTAIGGTVTVGAAHYSLTSWLGDDAVDRLIRYQRTIVPMVMAYKWEEAKCEKLPEALPWLFSKVSEEEYQRRFNVLHKKWAKPIFDCFMDLGGFYYKSGQKIASNAGSVFPKHYIDMFQVCNCIPMPNKYAAAMNE